MTSANPHSMQPVRNAAGVVTGMAVGAPVSGAAYYYGYWFSHLRD